MPQNANFDSTSKNWGAFDLIPGQFLNGWAGMKALALSANAQGGRVHAHYHAE